MDAIATLATTYLTKPSQYFLINFIGIVVLYFSIFLSFNEKNKETVERQIQFAWQIIIRNPVFLKTQEYMPDQ